jgi:MFS family permease
MGAVGLAALPGRAIFTPLAGRMSRYRLAAALLVAQGIGLLLLLGNGRAFVGAFVVLFGAGFGALTPARAAIVADAVGSAEFGRVNGLVALFVTGARAVAAILAASVHQLTGSYAAVLWLLAAACAAGAGSLLISERRLAEALPASPVVAQERPS